MTMRTMAVSARNNGKADCRYGCCRWDNYGRRGKGRAKYRRKLKRRERQEWRRHVRLGIEG